MFRHIIAPVDLDHLDALDRALEVTFDAARHYAARVTLVSATSPGPAIPEAFARDLKALADARAERHGVSVDALPVVVKDPETGLDDVLLDAVADSGADLVIMASHRPGLADYFWPSNGGKVAAHAGISVMLVRGD